jgi:tetratricopeptide (TPR) repeat protein
MLIDLSLEFANAGFYSDAVKLLELSTDGFPLVEYYKAYLSKNNTYLEKAFTCSQYCCFPNRLEDIQVLKYAIEHNKKDFNAPYYLGNLYYDKERHEDAIKCFEMSIERGADFATPYRNLSLLNYNVLNNDNKALNLMEKAFELDKTDARILYELDLLKKRMGIRPQERLNFLECYLNLVESRNDLLLEYITLLNLTKQYDKALNMTMNHHFHPWEGGEGKVPEQYIFSNVAIGTEESLNATFTYPENLGEGKLYGAQENRQNYFLGRLTGKKEYFEKASSGISEPASAMYYNDQPPETIFYQGMALKELGRLNEAEERFNKLICYADNHINDDVKIDYFAVSLPDLLVFDENLNTKNRLHCLFMKALGLYGKGEIEESKKLFKVALEINPNTFQISTHYDLLF